MSEMWRGGGGRSVFVAVVEVGEVGVSVDEVGVLMVVGVTA
jgi:hypothetical protein